MAQPKQPAMTWEQLRIPYYLAQGAGLTRHGAALRAWGDSFRWQDMRHPQPDRYQVNRPEGQDTRRMRLPYRG